jgi:hypothetical protein
VPRILYRLVANDPPTVRDMLSQAALGKRCPRPHDTKFAHEWAGTSAFDTEQAARSPGDDRRGRPPRSGWDRIGPFIAVLRLPDDAPIVCEGPSGAGHWLLYDAAGGMLDATTAAILLGYIERVLAGPQGLGDRERPEPRMLE